MASSDWEKELADIDRRLASVPDAPPVDSPPARGAPSQPARSLQGAGPGPAPAAPVRQTTAGAPAEAGRRIGSPTAGAGQRSWRTQLALLLRVLVGVGVVAALLYWPYPSRCGLGLGYYLALVGALALSGLWTSVSAWRHRAAFVHLLGLAMLVAAAVLGAREILPKTGYAYPTPDHPVAWACS